MFYNMRIFRFEKMYWKDYDTSENSKHTLIYLENKYEIFLKIN